MKPKSSKPCFQAEVSYDQEEVGPSSAPNASSPTRDIAADPSVICYVGAVSVSPSQKEATCVTRVPLTEPSIANATRSSVPLTVSSTFGVLPLAMKSAPLTILPCGVSPLLFSLYSLHTRPSLTSHADVAVTAICGRNQERAEEMA